VRADPRAAPQRLRAAIRKPRPRLSKPEDDDGVVERLRKVMARVGDRQVPYEPD